MTESRDLKRLVRKRMAETGESYMVARAHLDTPPARATKHVPGDGGLPTTVAAFKRKVYARNRIKDLAAHLEERYGIVVTGMTKLDLGSYRVDRRGAPSWVARLFASARTREAAFGDAEILGRLEAEGFPAERTAHPEPVSMLGGQPVLITTFVPGDNRRADTSEETMRSLGEMLARLHTMPELPGAAMREAGSWHHVSVNGGRPSSDVEILLPLLEDASARASADQRQLLDDLRGHLQSIDDLADLPSALIHPDPCSANLVAVEGDRGVLVDWTGAGRGPRVASFANLVVSVDALSLVDAAVEGYRRYAVLEPRELELLPQALLMFPSVLDTWMFLFRGAPLAQVVRRLEMHRQRAVSITERARTAFAGIGSLAPPTETYAAQSTLF